MLNEGWKPIGGIAFNNGFAHQAMAKANEEIKNSLRERLEISNNANKALSANEANKRLDELT